MGRDINTLHPELIPIVKEFIMRCNKDGLKVLITETFRTVQEQNDLYAKGRTKPGKIVTNCSGTSYQSAHQWGVAFDICKNIKGQEYNDSDNFFKKCGTIGKQLGLTWGGDWTGFIDKPHFEMKKYMKNASTTYLRNTYKIPDNFKKTWKTKGDEEMSYEVFSKYMEQYENEKGYNTFRDHNTKYEQEIADKPISEWAKTAFEYTVKNKIMSGDGKGKYRPKSNVTREELMQVVYNMSQKGDK